MFFLCNIEPFFRSPMDLLFWQWPFYFMNFTGTSILAGFFFSKSPTPRQTSDGPALGALAEIFHLLH